MRVISEERLLKLREHFDKDYSIVEAKVIQNLLNECQELNPWLPIDENTPKDRELLLFFPERSEFNLMANKQIAICSDSYLNHCFLKPTHYQELPADPENQEIRMARHISEESLREIAHETHYPDDGNMSVLSLLDLLISECKALNHWMTLDEFLKSGFEGECWIFTDYEAIERAYYDVRGFRGGKITNIRWSNSCITHVTPIRKPEPPR